MQLSSVLGNRPVFTLTDPLRVRKGMIVALTTPTWLSNLADYGASNSDAWRASREEGQLPEGEQDLLQRSRPAAEGRRQAGLRLHLRGRPHPLLRVLGPPLAPSPYSQALGFCSQNCSKASLGLCPWAPPCGACAPVPPEAFSSADSASSVPGSGPPPS